ncbi:MAG: molybdenum cofactor biosynthesis protein MoaE [Desulfobacterales bacterium]|nr:molybdenum cofactor biosynthesis protein MoaE [Desulfobacterales bacterium]MDX2512991.1 molybdenum cofactor biosynthesis protein MoaE [Desulfobacterales bacterium]
MDIKQLIRVIKNHPDYKKAGMILCHNGIVRSTSRDGKSVTGLTVQVDHAVLRSIIEERKQDPGIIEILVEIQENQKLSVGEDVMYLVVAGDIRENVIRTLQGTLDAIKSTATQKTEYLKKT